MSNQTFPGQVPFNDLEYHYISETLTSAYRRLCRNLFGPPDDLDRKDWSSEFEAFKIVILLSMCTLNDSDLARVNYCENTLLPLATYHEVTRRLCRELEACFEGAGEKLSWEKQTANYLELKEAREQVFKAWMKDLEAGALARMNKS